MKVILTLEDSQILLRFVECALSSGVTFQNAQDHARLQVVSNLFAVAVEYHEREGAR